MFGSLRNSSTNGESVSTLKIFYGEGAGLGGGLTVNY
jgi:hypothetical protein